ncbi:MAG: hypothetical protein RR321_05990 [Acidaminococcaceae bacterium]
MASWLQEFQAHNRDVLHDKVDTAVFEATGDNILKTASAMLEAKIKKEKIKELLIKYWDLRPSYADFFIEKAEDNQK